MQFRKKTKTFHCVIYFSFLQIQSKIFVGWSKCYHWFVKEGCWINNQFGFCRRIRTFALVCLYQNWIGDSHWYSQFFMTSSLFLSVEAEELMQAAIGNNKVLPAKILTTDFRSCSKPLQVSREKRMPSTVYCGGRAVWVPVWRMAIPSTSLCLLYKNYFVKQRRSAFFSFF